MTGVVFVSSHVWSFSEFSGLQFLEFAWVRSAKRGPPTFQPQVFRRNLRERGIQARVKAKSGGHHEKRGPPWERGDFNKRVAPAYAPILTATRGGRDTRAPKRRIPATKRYFEDKHRFAISGLDRNYLYSTTGGGRVLIAIDSEVRMVFRIAERWFSN